MKKVLALVVIVVAMLCVFSVAMAGEPVKPQVDPKLVALQQKVNEAATNVYNYAMIVANNVAAMAKRHEALVTSWQMAQENLKAYQAEVARVAKEKAAKVAPPKKVSPKTVPPKTEKGVKDAK